MNSDASQSPDELMVREEERRRLQDALDQLDPLDAEIVLLRNEGGLSNREAAQQLDLTEQAASMRYLRAKRRLRGILED